MKNIKNIGIASVLFLAMIVAIPSCKPSENIVYETFTSVNASGWDWKEKKSFKFSITDDQHYYTINCGLRINIDYSYSNIWLMYTLKGPNKFHMKDQFQMILSDNLGKWTGKGVSNLISFMHPFLNQQKLQKGDYTIEFYQNMRDEKLKDVNDVGLQIIKGQLIL